MNFFVALKCIVCEQSIFLPNELQTGIQLCVGQILHNTDKPKVRKIETTLSGFLNGVCQPTHNTSCLFCYNNRT